MRNTGGDTWESITPMVTKHTFFHYKYAVVKDDWVQYWERGIDRVADLIVAPNANSSSDGSYSAEDRLKGNHIMKKVIHYPGTIKDIVFEENWERFWV
jgi:hypothetical protein